MVARPDDEAFYVLTAVMFTPEQFPAVLGDDYPAACEALGLPPHPDGYGLILGQDAEGARWTAVVTDTALVACAVAAWDCGLEYDLAPPEKAVYAALPGWPLAVAVAAPGLPAPHDPAGTGQPPLTPPESGAWTPATRRLGADEIALQWASYRAEVDSGVEFVPKGDEDATPHQGVRRALSEAQEYTRTPPPPGRVRSAFAPGGARTVRADGPGWSLVARTDDIAFVLLDEEPGEILPVGRGPDLPDLLTALDELARG
jgi:hypothetical protein